jgi:mono/diheme cytochrome c family protein
VWKRRILLAAGAAAALLVLAQAVPYGRDHANPPARREPAWASPATRQLAVTACFDCHSNLTTWPWYSKVAPMSWLVQHDVDEGRSVLDFSDWGRTQPALDDVVEAVREGEMPPRQYTLVHRRARLTDTQRASLAAGLEATLRASPPSGG